MSIGRPTAAVGVCIALVLLTCGVSYALSGQAGRLASAKSIKCAFPLISTGTWEKDGTPKADVKPTEMVLQYDEIDVQEGTAQVLGLSGRLYIITRMSGVNLHLLAIDTSGPLYITTVFDKPSRPGKFKAAHSRHEFTDVSLPGYTSRPEQYYGECEILK